MTVNGNDSCLYDARDDLSITSREDNETEKPGEGNFTEIIFGHRTLVSKEVHKS